MTDARAGDASPTATVIGGGPAGLMAAEVLSAAGVSTTVFDHMRSVGRKFLLAGRGGLNLTHSEALDVFAGRYGGARDWLRPMLETFGPDDLAAWSGGLDQPTFTGSSGRVFPEAFRATPLLRAWLERLTEQRVMIETRRRWVGFGVDGDGRVDGRHNRFVPSDATEATLAGSSPNLIEVDSDLTLMALGGASWPRVGSTGSWVGPFTDVGIAVMPLRSANCGLEVDWSERFAERFAGTPIKNAAVRVAGPGGDEVTRGDLMVTRAGLEGGPVYAHSSALRRRLDADAPAVLLVDLMPDLDEHALAARLEQRGRPKDSLSTWLRRCGLDPVAVSLMFEATMGSPSRLITDLVALVKGVPVRVDALGSLDRAISSSGGVARDELDDALMVRRLPGLFVAGEMLDWEAPTGGYLLQASFTTAVVAARGALRWLEATGAARPPTS